MPQLFWGGQSQSQTAADTSQFTGACNLRLRDYLGADQFLTFTTMPTTNKTAPAERLRFVEPMYARAVQQLPEGKDWVYEVKFDGYRCLAGRDSTGVTLWSRRGNRFTDQFPQIAKACEHLPADTLLDGEIIALDETGRISFNMLQHHRSQAQAILFYAFDVIIHRGRTSVMCAA
jgi:ATP-dependent DNA ligase